MAHAWGYDPAVGSERRKHIACLVPWSPHHANLRYSTLLPQLESVVDLYRVPFSTSRLVRGIQFRLWKRVKKWFLYPFVLGSLAAHYRYLLTPDVDQVQSWPKPESVVVDLDDPLFNRNELKALKLPQVKVVVVTTNTAKALYQKLGVSKPIRVIPQPVDLRKVDVERVRRVATRYKGSQDIVVGYHSPVLTLSSEGPKRPRAGQDDVDLLLNAVEIARQREPRLVVWLIGHASLGVRRYASSRPWV